MVWGFCGPSAARLQNDRLVEPPLDVLEIRDEARSRNLRRPVLAVQAENEDLLALQNGLRTSVTSPRSKIEVESLRICRGWLRSGLQASSRRGVRNCDYKAPGKLPSHRELCGCPKLRRRTSRELDTYRSVPLRCRYQSPPRFESGAGTHLPGDMIGATRGRFGAATEQDNIIFAS